MQNDLIPYSFLFLSNNSFYVYVTFCISIYPLMDAVNNTIAIIHVKVVVGISVFIFWGMGSYTTGREATKSSVLLCTGSFHSDQSTLHPKSVWEFHFLTFSPTTIIFISFYVVKCYMFISNKILVNMKKNVNLGSY